MANEGIPGRLGSDSESAGIGIAGMLRFSAKPGSLTEKDGMPGSEGSERLSAGMGMVGIARFNAKPGSFTTKNGMPGSDGRASESAGIGIPGMAKLQPATSYQRKLPGRTSVRSVIGPELPSL